jgi:hypothetical protein
MAKFGILTIEHIDPNGRDFRVHRMGTVLMAAFVF